MSALLTLPPAGPAAPLPVPYFPQAWQAVLWRNWGLVPIERLARVLQTGERQLRDSAALLGLDPDKEANPAWLSRGYLSIIRANWHLLSYRQILELLDMRAEMLAFILKEDDFFWHKMGQVKPEVKEPLFAPLSAVEAEQTRAIGAMIRQTLAPVWQSENAFAFIERFTRDPSAAERLPPDKSDGAAKPLRLIYSYFALYGDPLLTPELDPFPNGLLAEYARMGVNGVWLQGILYQLVRFPFAPELSAGYEARQASLRDLVERAAAFGIGVYLYLNEPRAMHESFFQQYPHLRGTREGDFCALCTAQPEVRQYLEDGARQLFAAVPGLAGFFTITMSENLTNCYSRAGDGRLCPHCAQRSPWDVVAEVNNLLARGARAANPQARATAWNWAWGPDWETRVPALLSEGQIVQCTSETKLPTLIGGIAGEVSDYTMSLVGPGEKARAVWQAARGSGHEICAKVQFNNTWELSAVPWLPVFDKVAEHVGRLQAAGVRHLQLSWTLGGYPSPNLGLAAWLMEGRGDVGSFLRDWLGDRLGPVADAAQQDFCAAFSAFPFHIGVLYVGPQNYGPMVPFSLAKTGWKATMLGFPYDDLDGWRAIYPRAVFADQFERLVKTWQKGLARLLPYVGQSDDWDDLTRISEVCLCHFASTLNQIRFVEQRDIWLEQSDDACKQEMLSIIARERSIVLRLIELRGQDSRIGYESSNHYYYTLQDLAEKLINLRDCEVRLGQT
jgi:hypothetical protein